MTWYGACFWYDCFIHTFTLLIYCVFLCASYMYVYYGLVKKLKKNNSGLWWTGDGMNIECECSNKENHTNPMYLYQISEKKSISKEIVGLHLLQQCFKHTIVSISGIYIRIHTEQDKNNHGIALVYMTVSQTHCIKQKVYNNSIDMSFISSYKWHVYVSYQREYICILYTMLSGHLLGYFVHILYIYHTSVFLKI